MKKMSIVKRLTLVARRKRTFVPEMEKLKAVMAYIEGRSTVEEIAERFDVAQGPVYKWISMVKDRCEFLFATNLDLAYRRAVAAEALVRMNKNCTTAREEDVHQEAQEPLMPTEDLNNDQDANKAVPADNGIAHSLDAKEKLYATIGKAMVELQELNKERE